ncbi:hypothetical protein H5392_05350 [Tessaracoccus sp. MC1865]|uniref:hypothetical protein n=1 Tax=Tessaracoccus sp. MC1865 TaxID=2760310 RepID=UPI0016042AD8|nr:hypothetical protein [Tessaracoccus sp. MC1865]MBB1483290.1 hypothetical protein [Tessaracoccus sp. MC1865]QTO37298.1 hypothetical protein J7D54_12860 [Tessaracoccus sp. MC1865]
MTKTQTPTLDEIAAHGNRGHHHGYQRNNNDILCMDGTVISVIAGNGTWSKPTPAFCLCATGEGDGTVQGTDGVVDCDYPGPYDYVEVRTDHPELTDSGELKCFGIPVEDLRAWVIQHGGEFRVTQAAEAILRPLTEPGNPHPPEEVKP